ncbi:MFS transporter [Congregibacter variabilis]|uniref:MFS transporter n=1 Tax=Congregibacter variabilis TaxID=3081200 RepID=A0ABZ0HYR4_9GAMM|nr:MFS transporter [Congregibacter sp. IMCC43200]
MSDAAMEGADLSTETQKTVFDTPVSLAMGLYMSIVGYSVLAGVPVISSAWSALLGFSEVQVGRVAGADLGGLSLGAVIAALLVARMNRRVLVAVAVIAAIAANVLCAMVESYAYTLILRFVAGIASGVVTGVAVATLGARLNPARAFNYLLFSFAFVQAGEMALLPKLSMVQVYGLFALSYVPILFFLVWLPERPASVVHRPRDPALSTLLDQGVPSSTPWLFLLAMALTYINIGAYWTYIELATVDSELDAAWVSQVLIWVSFFSVTGCLFATLISDRWGVARPLLFTLVLHSATAFMLVSGIDPPRFLISLYAFNFLWIFVDVYQMGSVANLDNTGRYASLIPAAQGLGQIVGPNLAASLLAYGAGYSGVFVLCGCASMAAFGVYGFAYAQLRRAARSQDTAVA